MMRRTSTRWHVCSQLKVDKTYRLWYFTPSAPLLQIYGEDAPKAPAKAAPVEPVKQESAQFQGIYEQSATGTQVLV